jgi:hypothetical protein
MKPVSMVAMLLGLIAFSSPCAARETTFGVSGGLALPFKLVRTADESDAYELGFQAGGFVEHRINRRFAFGLGADHVNLVVTDATFQGQDGVGSVVLSVMADVALCAKLYANDMSLTGAVKVAPYVVGGGGVYVLKCERESSREVYGRGEQPSYSIVRTDLGSVRESKPGVFGGAGLGLALGSQVSVDVFAKMHAIFDADEYSSGTTMYLAAGLMVGFGRASR